MKFNRYDKKGLGALGAIILVILLLALAFVGGTAAVPYVVEQGFAVGDTFNYDWIETNGTTTRTATEYNTVIAITATSVTYSWYFSAHLEDNGTWTENITKYGNKVYINDWMSVDPSILPAERSYTVLMIGFNPMLVEAYVLEESGITMEFWVKAGTLHIVKAIWTDGDLVQTATLSSTSLTWLTLF